MTIFSRDYNLWLLRDLDVGRRRQHESPVCSEDYPWDRVRASLRSEKKRGIWWWRESGKNVAIFTANEHDRIMILTCPRILTAQDYSWHIKIPCLGKSHFRIKTSEHPWATRQHSAIIPPAVYWFIFNRHFLENRKLPSILNKTKYFRLRPYDEVS